MTHSRGQVQLMPGGQYRAAVRRMRNTALTLGARLHWLLCVAILWLVFALSLLERREKAQSGCQLRPVAPGVFLNCSYLAGYKPTDTLMPNQSPWVLIQPIGPLSFSVLSKSPAGTTLCSEINYDFTRVWAKEIKHKNSYVLLTFY